MEERRLFEVLDAAVEQLRQQESRSIAVATVNGTYRVQLGDIQYVERVGRIMRYYCTNFSLDSLTLRTSFKDAVASLLHDPRFYLCGASFAVNLQHVIGVSGHDVLLDSGASLTLPRTVTAGFKIAWGRFFLDDVMA